MAVAHCVAFLNAFALRERFVLPLPPGLGLLFIHARQPRQAKRGALGGYTSDSCHTSRFRICACAIRVRSDSCAFAWTSPSSNSANMKSWDRGGRNGDRVWKRWHRAGAWW